jgi:ubiquinone/menaquinone biosynthesis C-methylase UbiE
MAMKGICYLFILLLGTAAQAQESDYQKVLIEKFRFYKTARTVFAPVYLALARQLVHDYGITKGVAVDMGGAEGSMAVELAKITELKVYCVDLNPSAVRLCNILAEQNHLEGRVVAIEADATNLPLRDNLADLVISRNSLFQWKDKLAGFREAYRILKPGGVAYMGGGYSRFMDPETLKRLVEQSEEKYRKHPEYLTKMPKDLPEQLKAFGITQVRIIEGPSSFDWWLEMRKPK